MEPSETPSMFFLGVTTRASSVHRVFGSWTECLGRSLRLVPRDLGLKSQPSVYREFVNDIRENPRVNLGALVTSHKAALFDAASDMFDRLTPASIRLQEIGMIYWRDGLLVGDANDVLSTRQVARGVLLESETWLAGSKRAVIMGSGGAGVALANTLVTETALGCSGVILTELNQARAEQVSAMVSSWNSQIPVHVEVVASNSDSLVDSAGAGALIANATGLGKDREGSPITDAVRFPEGSFVWEFNYRFNEQSEPTFLEIARSQESEKNLIVEDGWDYFIWGWLGVMANVLGLEPVKYHDCFSAVATAVSQRS